MFFVGVSTAAMQRNFSTVVGGRYGTVEETAVEERCGDVRQSVQVGIGTQYNAGDAG